MNAFMFLVPGLRGCGLYRAAGGLAVIMLLALGISGCGRDEQAKQDEWLRQGVAAGMHPNILMDAAFGPENGLVLPGEVYWQAELLLPRLPANPGVQAPASAADTVGPDAFENQRVAVRAREAVRLSETRLALVIESVAQADLPLGTNLSGVASGTAANGVPAVTAASEGRVTAPVHIGVIFFKNEAPAPASVAPGAENRTAEKWRATRLVSHVDFMSAGSLPDVQVYKLDASRYLITYAQSACRQGACSSRLKGYLLQPEAMTSIFETRLAGSNARQYADCIGRLGVTHAGAAAAIAGLDEGVASGSGKPAGGAPAHACYAVSGEVHPLSRGAKTADVQIRFSGLVSEAPGRLRTIAQTQLFRLDGGRLKQIAGGENPVPGP